MIIQYAHRKLPDVPLFTLSEDVENGVTVTPQFDGQLGADLFTLIADVAAVIDEDITNVRDMGGIVANKYWTNAPCVVRERIAEAA